MKIMNFALTKLRNAEHFQFMTECKDLINRFGAGVLKITKLFEVFVKLYADEDELQVIIRKSEYTRKMEAADKKRDTTFRGMRDAINSALKHFNEAKAEAANRLKIVLNTYGDVAQKPADQQTADLYNLIQELEGKSAPDVATLGIGDWVAELKSNNADYEALVKQRDSESAEKHTDVKITKIRKEIDEEYRKMMQVLESLALIADGEEAENYLSFGAELNAVIKRYNNRLAQRAGKSDDTSEQAN